MRAGVVARGDRWSGRGNRERAEAILAGAERAVPPGDARGRRAGWCVRGTGGAAEVPVISAHGRRLVDGVVDEDLRGPLGHRGRRIWEGVTGRWWRWRAGQRAVVGRSVVDWGTRLVPVQRRRHSGRDGRRAVRPGAQLKDKQIRGASESVPRPSCYTVEFMKHCTSVVLNTPLYITKREFNVELLRGFRRAFCVSNLCFTLPSVTATW